MSIIRTQENIGLTTVLRFKRFVETTVGSSSRVEVGPGHVVKCLSEGRLWGAGRIVGKRWVVILIENNIFL